MGVTVNIPTSLRRFTDDTDAVVLDGETVGAVLDELRSRFPELEGRVFDDQGGVRRFVNVYLNDEDIRFLEQLATPVSSGAELSIIPAIAGG
tara:strand:+ start:502 stop:777 length:276 start_codon:yes stop_codon:yes gene_type:complete